MHLSSDPLVIPCAPNIPPSMSPAPEFSIAISKCIQTSHNPNPKYDCTLSYDRLSTYVSFASTFDFVSVAQTTSEAMIDPGDVGRDGSITLK